MRWQIAGILLLLCFLLPAVTAAEITLISGQQDYWFPTNATMEIPLAVENGFLEEVPGTVLFSTDARLQKTGVVMINTQNRVFPHTLPVGRSFLNLTMTPSPTPREYKVHISYYYTLPAPVNVSVPELRVHIVADPCCAGNIPSPVSSTSRPETGTIPSASSVTFAEQVVGTREQMGADGSANTSSSSGQPQAETEAARQQNQQVKARQEHEQADFDQRLENDPLFRSMNSSLSADGFTLISRDTQPASSTNGTFSLLYRRGAEDQVVVRGAMEGGMIPFVQEVANAPITSDPALSTNTSYQSFQQTLADGGYRHKETIFNRTPDSSSVTAVSTGTGGEIAYVNATTREGSVTRVTMEHNVRSWPFPVYLILVLVLGVAGIWLFYRRYLRQAAGGPAISSTPEPVSHQGDVEGILVAAERAFGLQHYPEAYGLAARALRVHLSHEFGDGREATATEIITFLSLGGHETRAIIPLLDRCSDVAYAKGEPGEEEFFSLVCRIREVIRS
ncbi:hypothetical protein [Methanoregula sp.]|uniref:hypothetical protein n=1 Tax=Methanoregula sp. TaxID=2052170 RepID=UPI00356B49D8